MLETMTDEKICVPTDRDPGEKAAEKLGIDVLNEVFDEVENEMAKVPTTEKATETDKTVNK